MSNYMDYTDFENEAEREEREAVQAGNPPVTDTDAEDNLSGEERFLVEEEQYNETMRALDGDPWRTPYYDVDPAPWNTAPFGYGAYDF